METVRIITDGINRKKAMKKIYRYFFAAIAIASTAACAEQMEDNSALGTQNAPADFAQMTISASLGEVTKTTYKDQSVLWEGTESITVFSKGSEDTPTEFEMTDCSGDKTSATFAGLANLNAESYYAVYPHSATNACTSAGVLTVNIPAQQTAVAGGFASGANVSVAAFARDDEPVIFKNVCALIAFAFDTEDEAENTAKVTFKVKNAASEFIGIAGNVTVSFDSKGEPVVSSGDAYQVDLTAPTDGFEAGVVYYVPVCPVGDFSGLQISYTAKDEYVFDKTNNTADKLTRSKLLEVGVVPDPYGGFPNDFQIILDFSAGWPFIESCPEEGNQVGNVTPVPENSSIKNGMYYTFNRSYEFGETKKIKTLQSGIALAKNCSGYKYENGAIRFMNSDYPEKLITVTYGGLIKIPAVPERYLTKVEIYHIDEQLSKKQSDGTFLDNQGAPMFNVVSSWPAVKQSNSTTSSKSGYLKFDIPFGSETRYITEPNSLCGVRLRATNIKITKLVFTYSKTKPE